MRITLVILFLLNSFTSIFGQTLWSQLKDAKSQTPIPYVTVGIVGKNIGTISDSLGNFRLPLAAVSDTDSLRISMIGYLSKDYKISDINIADFPRTIHMDQRIILLKEAVIGSKNGKPFELGLKKKYCYPIPLYKGAESKVAFPQKNYRYEIGTRFTNSKMISLDSIQLNFAECNVDSVQFRINIYVLRGDVMANCLSQPLYVSLTKSDALNSPVIHLTDQHLQIDSDFLITIENYTKLKDGALYLFANFKRKGRPYPTYYKDGIQGNWVQLKSRKSRPIAVSIIAFSH